MPLYCQQRRFSKYSNYKKFPSEEKLAKHMHARTIIFKNF